MQDIPCLLSIKNSFGNLTAVEKKIATYILENHESVIFMSVAELAATAGVAKSAVIRCCKSLGFEGYARMKLSLAAEVSKNKQLNYTPYIYPDDSASVILDKIFSANVKTLHDTAEKIDRYVLQNLVNELHAAKCIYIYGIGTSAGLVNEFQYRLMQQGFCAFALTDVPSMKISTLNITTQDIAIGISNSGRTVATIEALRLADAAGAKTACITSYPHSEITTAVMYPLGIYSDEIQYPVEAISSRIAHLSVIDTIVTALSALNYERTLTRSKNTRELVESVRYKESKNEKA